MLRGAVGLVADPEVIRRSGPHITEHGPAQRLPAAFRQPPPKLGICAPVIRNAGIGRGRLAKKRVKIGVRSSSKSSHAVFMPPSPSAPVAVPSPGCRAGGATPHLKHTPSPRTPSIGLEEFNPRVFKHAL